MDRRKGWKSKADSVIAGLMGLEQLCPRQPFHDNRRALSDSYISKSATVGLRVGSLVSIQASRRMKNESLKCGDGFDLDNSKNPTTSKGMKIANPSGGADKRSLDKSGVGCTQGNVVNCEQKYEHDLVAGHLGDLCCNCVKDFDLQSDLVIKCCFVKPKLEKGFKDGKTDIHSKSSPDENLVTEVAPRKCIGCTRNMNNVSQQVPDGQKFSEIKNAYTKHPSLNRLPSSNGSRKQNFGRRARITEVSGIEFSGRDQLQADVISLEGKKSAVEGKKSGKYLDQLQPSLKDLDYIKGVLGEMDNGSEHDKFREMELSKKKSECSGSNLTARNMNNITHASPEGFSGEACLRINSEALSAINPTILSVDGGHYSGVTYDFSREASNTEFFEESAYSNNSTIGTPDFQENPKRACQHSPDSVLEPFKGQYSSSDRSIDSIGLQFHLDILNLEAEYAYSEGSVMGVSGDDDSEKQFSDLSLNGKMIRSWLSHDESRNFSYMVDVLDEAGFCGIKSCMDFKTWYSLEFPINPLVFEALGKKYGKQTSWPQSERRLLFDSINSGLMRILSPVVNLNTSIKGFLCANLRRDEIEDALWQMPVHQQEEKKKGSSSKALEKWLEADEGMNIICTELQTSLMDELVGELVTALIDG